MTEPDLTIEASVRADELEVLTRGEVETRTEGRVERESETVRVNVPRELEARETYRDVRVRTRLHVRLRDR